MKSNLIILVLSLFALSLSTGCKEDKASTKKPTINNVQVKSGTKAGKKAVACAKKTGEKMDKENTLVIKLKDGDVKIALCPEYAPKHVERIKTLTKEGFYDGIVFHRVIEGFMAQTGDPTGTGMGGSKLPNVPAEFSDQPFVRGALGMARSQSPDSANSQFFIMFKEGSFLNGQYTVFGHVIEGMENVDKIKLGDKAANGKVDNPDKMISVRMASDL